MRLVIDANIAQSAGNSEISSSRCCRECLNAVLEHEHTAVFSQPLREEWRNHSSLYARRWWRSMSARRRIEFLEGAEFAIHLDRACACLPHNRWKEDLRKDFHLVQSALASDQTILSNEQDFPRYVATACGTVRVLSNLYYASPQIEQDRCIAWIEAGAEKHANRRIDAWALNHLAGD